MRELDPLVFEYQHEKRRPRESEALLMLRKIASLVKPIMRRRSWRVRALCEFSPRERNLLGLNINGGQKICLRLRHHSDERQFLPMEHVLDTMLHEWVPLLMPWSYDLLLTAFRLCHIVHGPHNREFHALWNQLRDEHEELAYKGYTGEGFLSQGRRLGGKKIPLDEARRQARATAAEQRRTMSAGSGRRVGGTPALRGADMRKVIADAAQRRMEVTRGCASGTHTGDLLAEEAAKNGFRTKAEEDDANEQAILQAYIELIEEEEREKYGSTYIPPSQQNPAGPRGDPFVSTSPPVIPEHSKPRPLPTSTATASTTSGYIRDSSRDDDVSWTCPICTLDNPPNFLCCDACAAERPAPKAQTSTVANNFERDLVSERERRRQQEYAQVQALEREKERKRRRPAATADPTFNQFKNRSPALQSLKALDRDVQKRPLGWVCRGCGAFMETEWWTCSSCGVMKEAS